MSRYLVQVRIADSARIREAVPVIMEALGRLSGGEHQLAFSSASAETFGVFVKTDVSARQIRAAIEKSTAMRADDHILVLELATDFDAIGNSRGWQWLQHH